MKKLLLILSIAAISSMANAISTDFESFDLGTVDGQGGWTAASKWDEEVVDLGGNKAWRISNKVTSGSFGDMPISPGTGFYAGESTSTHLPSGNSAATNRYIASFDFWSVTGEAQTGLDITVSPDDGQGSRQSFISIEDNGNGIDLDFYDSGVNDSFTGYSLVASSLSYTDVHSLMFDITFVDGINDDGNGNYTGNDIVDIYVDGALVHTASTWESYYYTTYEGQTPPSVRAIDSLLFRLSTDNGFSGENGGFYIDNIKIETPAAVPAPGAFLLGSIGVACVGWIKRRRAL